MGLVKPDHFYIAVLVDEDIAQTQVAVNYPILMHVIQSTRELACDCVGVVSSMALDDVLTQGDWRK